MDTTTNRGTCLLAYVVALLLKATSADEMGGGSAGATSALLFELPAATDFYANEGNIYFDPNMVLFSQTIKLMSQRDRTYWGVAMDEITQEYIVSSAHKGEDSKWQTWELLDVGTMDNLPRNTRPRTSDAFDKGTQRFALRFNESFMLRNEATNMYLGQLGVGWSSTFSLVESIDRAMKFMILPIRNPRAPQLYPIARNTNLGDLTTYITNGTSVRIRTQEMNYVNHIPGSKPLSSRGPGTNKISLWKASDIFVVSQTKIFEG